MRQVVKGIVAFSALLAISLGCATVGAAQNPPAVEVHEDGQGVTIRQGNQTLVRRNGGHAELITRVGNWEYRQHSNGVYGAYYYDNVKGVQRYDFRDPRTGQRKIGENPYPNTPYYYGWGAQGYGW